jgi:hypothetical protein
LSWTRGAEPLARVAACYAALGEKDHAMAVLDQAYKAQEFVMFFLKVDPRFDSLRYDPRFQDLIHRIGFPP